MSFLNPRRKGLRTVVPKSSAVKRNVQIKQIVHSPLEKKEVKTDTCFSLSGQQKVAKSSANTSLPSVSALVAVAVINELSPINLVGADAKTRAFKSLCPVKLNGHASLALIDSGNLVVNAISEAFAKRLYGMNVQDHLQPLKFTHIGTADKKGKLQVLGVTKQPVTLRFGGSSVKFLTHPIVIKELSMDVNISGPFLAEKCIDQMHSKGALKVKGQLIPLIDYKSSKVKKAAVLAIKELEKKNEHYAYVANSVTIPANSAAYIVLRIPHVESQILMDGEGVIDVCEHFANKTVGHPALSVAVRSFGTGQCYTSVLNLNPEPIVISEGQLFGTYNPGEVEKTPEELRLCSVTKPVSEQEKLKWLEEEFKLREAPWLKGNPALYQEALQLLLEFYDLMGHGDEYGKTTLIQHEIRTHDVPPIKMKGKPINPPMQELLREQMDVWRQQDVIEPSSSPWSAGLIPVAKKNGKTRWVVDYRALNEVTLKDSYPLPNMEDNLSRLSHSRVFSAIDGAGAFHAISIRPEDREKTAFHTPWGLWQYKQMPFGLCNAPATYSRLVQRVLEDIPTSIALPYLDDTCIHTRTVKDHIEALRRVFQAHKKAGLMLQPAKCHLFQKEVEYLGHLVTAEGIRPRESYVQIIKDWPLPKDLKGWRTFLGKVTYYKKFIPRFSHICTPLTALLNKENEQDLAKIQVGSKEEKPSRN